MLYHWTYTACFRSILFFPSTVVKYHYSSDHDHGWTNGYTQHNMYRAQQKLIASILHAHDMSMHQELKSIWRKSRGEQIARYTQHVAIMHNKITSILHALGILKKNIMRLAMQYSNQLMLQDRPASFCFLSNASRITDHSRNFNETDNIKGLYW